MHGLAFYLKEGLPFAWELTLENSYLCSYDSFYNLIYVPLYVS